MGEQMTIPFLLAKYLEVWYNKGYKLVKRKAKKGDLYIIDLLNPHTEELITVRHYHARNQPLKFEDTND